MSRPQDIALELGPHFGRLAAFECKIGVPITEQVADRTEIIEEWKTASGYAE